ncbi:MAG: PEP-CTERM sorting domain-containing protein [Deltaproteobacteria bacterium]|nr:PEP-CTERM sorting domain-containing protein [Deltaproteobacteria bacterium]
MSVHLVVTQVFLLGLTPIAFDFSGTYEIRATQTAIPEPGSMALLGVGLAGLAILAPLKRVKLAL